MKAVILAGGEGTRLHPLTYTRPKTLIPILDRPMVDYTLDYFRETVDEIIFAAGHMVDELRSHLDSIGEGSRVRIVTEESPLGTGGAVKNVEGLLDEPFIVLNADIISSIDMKDFISFAEQKGGMGSIALYPSSHPEDYGVVELENGHRIVRFVEKPSREEAFSNLINAGAYYLKPEILDMMEPNQFVSMEREIFPLIIDDGFFGYRVEGHWVDVGKVDTYLEAVRTLLGIKGSMFDPGSQIGEVVQVIDPVHVGSRSVMRSGIIGPDSSVGNGCDVGTSTISGSVLFDNVKVGENVTVTDSVLGEGVAVEDDSILKGCVVGDGETIGQGSDLVNQKVGMR
jgi:NDP-sugar pyrophosphorylase family protein